MIAILHHNAADRIAFVAFRMQLTAGALKDVPGDVSRRFVTHRNEKVMFCFRIGSNDKIVCFIKSNLLAQWKKPTIRTADGFGRQKHSVGHSKPSALNQCTNWAVGSKYHRKRKTVPACYRRWDTQYNLQNRIRCVHSDAGKK